MFRFLKLATVASAFLLIAPLTSAQFTTVLNIPDVDPNIGNNGTIGSDTQLNLFDGGAIGSGFAAGSRSSSNANIEVNINGGSVGRYFTANQGSTVNISDGIFGDPEGFSTDVGVASKPGSEVNIAGGEFYNLVELEGDGHISGGLFRNGAVLADDDSKISGGYFFFNLFNRLETKHLVGNNFYLDGVPITGLDNDGDTVTINFEPTGPNDYGRLIEGTLADGTPVISGVYSDRPTITLHAAELPPVVSEEIEITSAVSGLHYTKAGQTITVLPGGFLEDPLFASRGSTINFEGGSLGKLDFMVGERAVLYDSELDAYGSTINIRQNPGSSAWYSPSARINAYKDSVVNVHQSNNGYLTAGSGGTINLYEYDNANLFQSQLHKRITVYDGGTINLYGGSLVEDTTFDAGSTINLYGGDFRSDGEENIAINLHEGTHTEDLNAYSGSVVTIYDGFVEGVLSAHAHGELILAGGSFNWRVNSYADSQIKIVGADFKLNGEPITGLDNLGDIVSLDVPDRFVLSGTYANGTPFLFSDYGSNNNNNNSRFTDFITDGTLSLKLTEFDNSIPSAIETTISTSTEYLKAKNNETINLVSGGFLAGRQLAGKGSTVNFNGGSNSYELFATGATVNINHAGSKVRLRAFDGSEVNISEGSYYLRTERSSVNVTGGEGELRAERSDVYVSGGLNTLFSFDQYSSLNILGGNFQYAIFFDEKYQDNEIGSPEINLYGTSFLVDGKEIPGLSQGSSIEIETEDLRLLEAALADGNYLNGMIFGLSGLGYYQDGVLITPHDLTVNLHLMPEDFLAGDYNADGKVDAADYTVWRDNQGEESDTLANNIHVGAITNASYETWAANFGATLLSDVTLAGDFNEDGVVNAADYTLWRDNIGAVQGSLPNDPHGGFIGQMQYETWVANYGMTLAENSTTSTVPEPSALFLLLLSLAAKMPRRVDS